MCHPELVSGSSYIKVIQNTPDFSPVDVSYKIIAAKHYAKPFFQQLKK